MEHIVAIVGNTYQPGPRHAEFPQGEPMDIASFINEDIYQRCYYRLFVEGEIPQEGFYFSFYPTIRSWIKENHPDHWKVIQEKVARLPDKEFKVLGSLLIHSIGPLESAEDLDDLIEMESKAFQEDFGFRPKGIWPPETAISTPMLKQLKRHGYEFVMLRDTQLQNIHENPMFIDLGDGEEIAVFHFNSELSADISFHPWATTNVDQSMEHVFGRRKGIMVAASDTELYGWYGEHKEMWLRGVTSALNSPEYARRGFRTLSIRQRLEEARKQKIERPNAYKTRIHENSSWSCDHGNLGRWTGECNCENPSQSELQVKRGLYKAAHEQNILINTTLSAIDSIWRPKLREFFVKLRGDIFNGRNFMPDLQNLTEHLYTDKGEHMPEDIYLLYGSKIYDYISRTSCAWFYPDDNRVERDIARLMTRASKFLLDEYKRRQPNIIIEGEIITAA